MSILADTPRWPRHGTVWGHMVSDVSLEELHAAADVIGLHPRSFDLDHYDWPAPMRGALEQFGVEFVDPHELTRRLIASGLRVPLKHRQPQRNARTRRELEALGLAARFHLRFGGEATRASAGSHPGGRRSVGSSGAEYAGTIVDLVAGERGHANPLPGVPGYARVARDPGREAYVEASDPETERLIAAVGGPVGLLGCMGLGARFVGQALVGLAPNTTRNDASADS